MNDILYWLDNVHLLRPWWLVLLLPFYWVLKNVDKHNDQLSMWRSVMSKDMLTALTVSGTHNKLISPKSLTWLIFIIVVLVLAGPSWKQQKSPFTQDKSALVIALDVSSTMEQHDVQPSRLLRAKQKIVDLLALRGDSLTALIAFAGSAHVVMPATNDREMISHFLDVLEQSIIPVQGKVSQNIIPLTKNILEATSVPGNLLLITDGVSAESTSYFHDYFAQHSHQLVVWGIGSLPLGVTEEADSSLIPIQIAQLERLTDENYAQLVLMTHDKSDVSRVNRYLKNNPMIVDDEATPWYDSGYPLVFVVGFLFLFWFRKGWTLQW